MRTTFGCQGKNISYYSDSKCTGEPVHLDLTDCAVAVRTSLQSWVMRASTIANQCETTGGAIGHGRVGVGDEVVFHRHTKDRGRSRMDVVH
jgi:hypothetical protein